MSQSAIRRALRWYRRLPFVNRELTKRLYAARDRHRGDGYLEYLRDERIPNLVPKVEMTKSPEEWFAEWFGAKRINK